MSDDDPLPAMDHRGLSRQGKTRLRESELAKDYLVSALEDADPSVLSAIISACDNAHGKRFQKVQMALHHDEGDSQKAINDAYWALLQDLRGLSLLASELRSDQRDGTPSEEEPRLGI